LSRSRNGRPKRNVLPGVVILMTGWAMSAHPQQLELSTMVHSVFGYTLMAAGAARVIEISFVLKDSRGSGEVNSWQHLPPFLLYASGFLFMGATEEQMQLLSDAGVTHVAYILILYSIAFLLYLFVNILLYVYASHAWPDDESNGLRPSSSRGGGRSLSTAGPSGSGGHSRKVSTLNGLGMNGSAGNVNGHVNGSARLPRHRGTDSQQVRDAEEFELEGLISDDGEEMSSPAVRQKEGGVALA